jgi:hypothetical protein
MSSTSNVQKRLVSAKSMQALRLVSKIVGRKINLHCLYTGISKYLRHSEAVSSKHYDFSQIEQGARNRAAVVNLIGGL